MRRLTIVLFAVVVAAVLFCVLFTFVGKPYERDMLDRFGKVIRHPQRIAYNWYLCLPTDHVVRMDMRLHLYQSTNHEIPTSSGKPILVRSFAAWRITNPVRFYTRLPGGDRAAQSFINSQMESFVGNVMGRYHLDNLFSLKTQKMKMRHIENEIRAQVNTQLAKEGLTVATVGFSRISFPPQTAMHVYARMTSERNKLAETYQSEGESQAKAIRAHGREQAAAIQSAAEKQAKEIRGQGDAKAYSILNAAQTTPQARKFYRFWKAMQLFRTSMGKGTYFVLTPDNPITAPLFTQLRQLEPKPAKAKTASAGAGAAPQAAAAAPVRKPAARGAAGHATSRRVPPGTVPGPAARPVAQR